MLNFDEYIKKFWKVHDDYISNIKSGEIPANRWIKKTINNYENLFNNSKFEFKKEKVEKAVKFFSLLNIPINNRYQQFEFIPYQTLIIANLFGWYYKNTNRRKYNYFYLFISRKNGKTFFAAALNLYLLASNDFLNPESILVALTTKQSGQALKYAKQIVSNSPEIKQIFKNQQYQIKYKYNNSEGTLQIMAGDDAQKLESFSPSSAILDEIHSYTDDSVFQTIRTGVGARRNYLISLITTAGNKVNSWGYEYLQTQKNIIDGLIDDENIFSLIYTLDDDDDYNNEKNWYKSNPALDYIIEYEYLEQQFYHTKIMPSTLRVFLSRHLNIYTNEVNSWIDNKTLSMVDEGYDIEILKGHTCYMSLDLSSTRDLSSLVCIFYIDNIFYVLPFFFFANNQEKKTRKGGINLSKWINEGHIIQCQTTTIDYDLILSKIIELSQLYNIEAVGYDNFNSALIIPKIEELGINCYNFPQTAKHFNFPLKYLEKQIYDKKIKFNKNPVMMWNFRNIVLYEDGNQNIKILKNKSNDSVDGPVALGMAMGQFININLDIESAALNAYNNQ